MSSKFLHPFYFFLIGISIFVLFAISVYLYILTPHRLEPIVLYYVDVSTEFEDESHNYLQEVRNIPMSTLMVIPSMYRNDSDLLVRFIHELFLGPKNIYARNLIPTNLVLDKVYVVDNDILYIVLKSTQNSEGFVVQSTLAPQDEHNIVKWVNFNVNKYFDIEKTLIIINKVPIK